ncbi:MAG: hypothetical protein IK081_08045 [Lachnospiraceae bacterium]|nr:hypothetical protein [Lachnospiraceae bacterium]
MSKEEKKNAAATQEKAEKVMTKYDLKMQKRAEEKRKEKRAKDISTVVSIVILLALAAFVLSFPIRTYISLHKTYITIGNENVTKAEYDFVYNTVVNNYLSNYSSYISWLGLDTSKDFAEQQYYADPSKSWKDYFDESTVDSLRTNKALKADAQAKGFTKDLTEEYKNIVEQNKRLAKEAGVSYKKFLQECYGPYATESRIKPLLEENLLVNAYYKKLSEDMTPSAEEIQAKYDAESKDYDYVDYRIKQFDAVLPTAPTDLADPASEAETPDGNEEETAYVPSEAEVEKAMADAKELAEAAKSTIASEGEEVTGISYASTNDVIRDWLFEDGRKSGDVTVLEDKNANRVYCVQFTKRYLDETPSADIRILVADNEEQAREMYNDWQNGGASEEYFKELCNGKYEDAAVAEDGLVEAISKNEELTDNMHEWLFAEGRKAGDCEVVTEENGVGYVIYYVGENHPDWYCTIESNLRSTAVNDYVTALKETCQVSDPDKNLNYLVLEAEKKSSAASAEEGSEAESTAEESSAEGSAE